MYAVTRDAGSLDGAQREAAGGDVIGMPRHPDT